MKVNVNQYLVNHFTTSSQKNPQLNCRFSFIKF